MRGHRALRRKLFRDLRRHPAQSVAIAVTVMLGVLLYVAGYDSYRNLSSSYEQTYTRLHFADLTATGGDPAAVAAAVQGAAGVDRVSTRLQADVPMDIGGTKLLGRVTGLPSEPGRGVNEVSLTAGSLPDPAHPDQIVVETHAATTFGLQPGSRLRISDGRAWHEVTVTGIVRSPEYLWPARSRQDVLDDPHSFAVVFAPPDQALRLTGRPGPDQTLVGMSSGATRHQRDEAARRLRDAGAADVTGRADQPSNAALHEDLSGFSEMAVGFPLLFLLAAAIAAYVMLTRLTRAERPVIGTLLAMGARKRSVIAHYTAHGVVISAIGALAGSGSALSRHRR